MTLFRDFSSKNNLPENELSASEKNAVYYHNIFDYPLTFNELIKWSCANKSEFKKDLKISFKNGFYFVDGREGLVYKRNIRKRISEKKLEKARKAAKILSLIPFIKMVGVTGSLAMKNADKFDDLDMLIITKQGTLWTTRLLSYLLLKMFNLNVRKPGKSNQNDELCLNMWLDEIDLVWSKRERNIYSAHEILQITPLINKEKSYEKFVASNKWTFGYWPNAVEKNIYRYSFKHAKLTKPGLVEKFAFLLQKIYMKTKITREFVSSTRAIFHPRDLSKVIIPKLDT